MIEGYRIEASFYEATQKDMDNLDEALEYVQDSGGTPPSVFGMLGEIRAAIGQAEEME